MKLPNVKLVVFLIPFFITASHNSQSAPISSVISSSGITEIAAKSKYGHAKVVFLTKPATTVAIDNCFVVRESDISPVLILRDLEIYVDGHALFVPRSSFSDLESPREATLRYSGHTYFLELSGGDGAESYWARIYFNRRSVMRKKVFSTIAAGGPISETRYFDRSL